MASSRWIYLIMAGFIILVGCKKPRNTGAPPAPVQEPMFYLDHAQPRLPTIKLRLGAQELVTELARKPVEIATGMMYREKMEENEAMLFVFPDATPRSFYMRNTRVPLSCAYIDPQGTILEIHDMKPLDDTPIPSTSDNIQYVLEVRQGWFGRHNVSTNTVVRSESGTLYDTFFNMKKEGVRP